MNARTRNNGLLAAALAAPLAASGCLSIQHKVDPIKVEPIYATLDINLKIDRQLDDFFAFEHQTPPPATAPAPAPGPGPAAAAGDPENGG
jgi:hypothetical protein